MSLILHYDFDNPYYKRRVNLLSEYMPLNTSSQFLKHDVKYQNKRMYIKTYNYYDTKSPSGKVDFIMPRSIFNEWSVTGNPNDDNKPRYMQLHDGYSKIRFNLSFKWRQISGSEAFRPIIWAGDVKLQNKKNINYGEYNLFSCRCPFPRQTYTQQQYDEYYENNTEIENLEETKELSDENIEILSETEIVAVSYKYPDVVAFTIILGLNCEYEIWDIMLEPSTHPYNPGEYAEYLEQEFQVYDMSGNHHNGEIICYDKNNIRNITLSTRHSQIGGHNELVFRNTDTSAPFSPGYIKCKLNEDITLNSFTFIFIGKRAFSCAPNNNVFDIGYNDNNNYKSLITFLNNNDLMVKGDIVDKYFNGSFFDNSNISHGIYALTYDGLILKYYRYNIKHTSPCSEYKPQKFVEKQEVQEFEANVGDITINTVKLMENTIGSIESFKLYDHILTEEEIEELAYVSGYITEDGKFFAKSFVEEPGSITELINVKGISLSNEFSEFDKENNEQELMELYEDSVNPTEIIEM